MDEQQRRQMVEEDLRWMREERDFQRGVQERVRWFAAAWRSRAKRSWLTPHVLALARVAKNECQFDVLPVLADALEEAGCTDQIILDHLRRTGPHVRACWAVDLLLAK